MHHKRKSMLRTLETINDILLEVSTTQRKLKRKASAAPQVELFLGHIPVKPAPAIKKVKSARHTSLLFGVIPLKEIK